MSLNSYTRNATGKTGQKCSVSGVYRCVLHTSQTIPLSKGETFPPCSIGRHGTTWELVRAA